jgi:NAD(P)-dependent dehydrogenase (short-subunit alcohol dehydrogenase family)
MKDETIVITGASGGIGRGLVEGLLNKGYQKVAALCHTPANTEPLKVIFSRFDKDPEKHIFCADIGDAKKTEEVFEQISKTLGPIAGLVNNAGATSNGMSWKLPAEEFIRIHQVNLFGSFYACKEVLPVMRERNYGRIINISSIVSVTGVPGTSHYSASKSGLNGLTRAIASEVANKDITVNAIALGYFDVGMIDTVPESIRSSILASIPKKRFGKVSELVALIDFLFHNDSGYLTGQVLHLNGGLY